MLDKESEDSPEWKIFHGQGDNEGTGPSDGDYYFYAEADRKPGDKTNMNSVEVPATEPSYCLIFSIHMYGEDMGELSVQFISYSKKEEIFRNQGNFWYTYNVTFYLPNLHGQNFSLVFEATQGNGIKGGIAIKNIVLYHGRCGKWKIWETWSPCNMSDCKRRRTRECDGGNVCEGPTADFEGCTNCTYSRGSQATDWGECSASCGFGIQTLDNGYGRIEYRQCFIRDCIGEWKPWSQWTCPCRNGERLRFRNCRGQVCYGQDTDQIPCAWGDWSRWSSCSASCGIGERRRYRYPPSETNCDMQVMTEHCILRVCRDIFWTIWGPCSATCQGIQRRTRSTVSWNQTQSRPCGQANCKVPIILIGANEWASWKTCSSSCGLGSQTRQMHNSTDTDSRLCILSPCIAYYSKWSEWGDCNTTCDDRYKNRTRECGHGNCIKMTEIKIESCNKESCNGWSIWTRWTCGVTCGSGTKMRSRYCRADICVGHRSESDQCTLPACPEWTTWSKWTCDVTCGRGTKSRDRSCRGTGCVGLIRHTTQCTLSSCPEWSPWWRWTCDVTCGSGTKSRNRHCRGTGCVGLRTESEICSLAACTGGLAV